MFNFSLLKSKGWVSGIVDIRTEVNFANKLLSLAQNLGTPIPSRTGRSSLYDVLKPIEAKYAKHSSLSKNYSLGEFPLHTDTAHWLMPCRYIILGCLFSDEGNRRTLLFDAKNISLNRKQNDLLYSVPLRINNGRNSFFDTILSKRRRFIRYDPGCMKPICKEGYSSLSVFSKQNYKEDIKEIKWFPGKVLIIDNWRLLHGRSSAACEDLNRTLIRILIR